MVNIQLHFLFHSLDLSEWKHFNRSICYE